MQRQKPKMNGKMFVILALIIIAVIGLFTYFIYMFTKYDKTEYEVAVGSILYNSDLEYIKVTGDAYITQKFDRNYYLYEKKNDETTREKLGKNTVVYKEGDMYMYIYGTAYQILSSGDVDTLNGETKVVKSAPTKFFKMDDRQYLIVDGEIRTPESDVLETKEYLLVNIDKKGNPQFSNHLVDFKTIAKTTVSTSLFHFDIANEKLTFDKKEIDLKNVIGSSNEYEPPKEEKKDYTDEKLEALQNNIQDSSSAIVGYYDQYFSDVVSSVNNLTQSVIGVNNNTIASLSKDEVYYDFDKWLVLKKITTSTATIDVEYGIFDPTNEFQAVNLTVDGPQSPDALGSDPDKKTYSLSKSESKYTVRGLSPNTAYTITLAYTVAGNPEPTVEDSIIATTKKDTYTIKVNKISYRNGNVLLDYEINIDKEYKFSNAILKFASYATIENYEIDVPLYTREVPLTGSRIDNSGTYKGQLVLDQNMEYMNVLKLYSLNFCSGEDCTASPLTVEYKFFSSSDESATPEETPDETPEDDEEEPVSE